MGIQVLEQLCMDWLRYSVGKSNENPVKIISLPEIIEELLKLKVGNPLTKELFVMDEIIELKERYNIPKVIITHLEED